MTEPVTCPTCNGSGIVTWQADGKGWWEPCICAAGIRLSAELRKGRADIKAGRLHKWSDVRRRL